MNKGIFRLACISMVSATALMAASAPAYAQQAETRRDFNIRAQPLASALIEFSQQGDVVVTAPARLTRQRSAPAVRDRLTPREALQTLLAGSGLSYRVDRRGTFIITANPQPGEAQAAGAAADSESADAGATPEILVVGRRTLNTDIRRTEDDAQPYVVFGQAELRESQATSLEEFFRARLPMNTSQAAFSQNSGGQTTSQINLRGLGTNQTLVLVDGRRLPSVTTGGNFGQPDINGIPISSVERVEILPSTASGIYGGGATGGVINIITRRDYTGFDLTSGYGSTFRGDTSTYRLEGTAGLSLEGGNTRLMVSASYVQSNPLFFSERDFNERAREVQLRANAAAFTSAAPPPLGSTSNIRSQNGSNLVLDNGTPLNSPITFVPIGYAGPATDNGAALVPNAGRFNLDIPADPYADQRTVLSGRTQTSLSASVRRSFGPNVEVYADLSWLRNKGTAYSGNPQNSVTLAANAPNNPFTTPVVVTFPATAVPIPPNEFTEETLRATGGGIVRLPREWALTLDYVWARARTSSTSNGSLIGDADGPTGPAIPVGTALANGTLNVMRDLNAFPLDWSPYLLPVPGAFLLPTDATLNNASLLASGPLFSLPAGKVRLSSRAEWRDEAVDDTISAFGAANGVTGFTFFRGRSQRVLSLYLETQIPLVSERNALPFAQALDIQASVRHDDYRTRAPSPNSSATIPSATGPFPSLGTVANSVSSTSYTLGLRYVPVRGLTLRASHGTGFLPPSINQLSPSVIPTVPSTDVLIDPRRGNVAANVGPYFRLGGGSPGLIPETSRSWSIGAVLEPTFLPGLRLSLDYTKIRKVDEIRTPTLQQVLDLEELLPGRVARAPLLPSDAALGYTGGVIQSIDISLLNVARSRLEAYDFQADYTLETSGLGRFHFYAIATYQPELAQQIVPSAAFTNTVGFLNGPLEWRGNFGLTWDRGPWTVNWNSQYYDSYLIYNSTATAAQIATAVLNQGSARIPSEIYHDLSIGYRIRSTGNPLVSGAEITFAVQNLFDRQPAARASIFLPATYSLYGDPRLRRFMMTLRTRF